MNRVIVSHCSGRIVRLTSRQLSCCRGGRQPWRGRAAFLLCTFWLAQAWALAGDPARAREVFDRGVAFVNDVGLLSEEVDSGSRALLGNYPQAFSHIGLLNAAWAIGEAERAEAAE